MTGLYVASNVKSLGAQITLQRNVGELGDVLTRLSTGLRINSAKDDPAGLIASELLKSDITATKQAIKNTQRANGVISVADSALGQVSNLLNDVRGLVNAGASTGGMSEDQIAANQLQIDASIDSIDRIANTTTFQGKKLLDGSMDFRTVGTNNSQLSNVKINAANFGSADALSVKVNLLETARTGQLAYNGTGVSVDTVLQVGGSVGSEIFKFGAGTTNAEMADSINRATDSTGVAAYVEGAAARGNVVLSSAGGANDILITAKDEGVAAGNYSFRIVQGATNDAKVVSSPNANGTGVVEITLARSYEKTYNNAVGMFDVTINTGNGTNATAVSFTHGNENRAYLNTTGTIANASSITAGATELTSVTAVTAGAGGDVAKLNGWTFVVGSVTAGTAAATYDTTNKVATLSSTATSAAGLQAALNIAVTSITGASAAGTSGATVGAGNLVVGNSFTLASQTAAIGQSTDGLKTVTVSNVTGTNAQMSNLNGWTVNVGSISAGAASQTYDYDAKTVTLNLTAASDAQIQAGMSAAAIQITGATAATITNTNGTGLVVGDKFKLDGGAATNELVVTYKSGATAQDIVTLMNNVNNVSAGLSAGVNGSTLVPDVLPSPTYLKANKSNASDTTSNATAQTVIDLINNKLGNLFEATEQIGEGTSQKVSFMNASATSGDVNLDNALRFTGMDSGPVVRMVTTDALGNAMINQKLSVQLINPSEADIAAGISTKILQVNLATDSSGNSTTTAAQLADFFDTLTTAQTGGVSAEVLTPPGVDPNGRTWVTDACGVTSVVTDCNAQYGLGIVQATGVPGICDIQQSDIVLLGNNQTLQASSAVAKIAGMDAAGSRNAIAVSNSTAADGMSITFDNTSAMNGVGFRFTADAAQAGFDAIAGTLTVYLDPTTLAQGTVAGMVTGVQAQLNGAIKENWADIREFTGATGGPVTGTVATGGNIGGGTTTGTLTTHLLTTNGTSTTSATPLMRIPGSTNNLTPGVSGSQRGVGPTDAALTITATGTGTDMAGVKVVFQKDTTLLAPTGQAVAATMLTEGQTPIALAFTGGTDGNLALLQGWNVRVNDGGTAVTIDATNKTINVLTAAAGDADALLTAALRGITGSTNLAATLDDFPDVGEGSTFRLGVSTPTTNMVSDYDANTGVLTIRANADELSAFDVARDLNANATFASQFSAAAMITATGAGSAANTGSIGFTTNVTPAAEFTGGYNIITARNNSSTGTNQTGTSAGIAMIGQSDSNERLVLTATESGSANFVNVNVIDGSFRTFCPLGYEMSYLAGTDANITVNGQKTVTHGNNFSVSSGILDMSGTLNSNMQAGDSTTFDIVAGGATFQLGPDVVSSQQLRISLPSVTSVSLGGSSGLLYQLKSGGNADLSTNTKLADKIVQEAITSVTNVRGRLGAIQRSTLEPNISALQDTVEQLSSAEALISNADFAEESSRLTRAQILVQSGAQALSLANQMPQYAAQLVR